MFKTFKVGELFDIHPTSAYKMKNDELFASDGTTPVLSNSSVSNGIGGYCGLTPTEQGGMITFSDIRMYRACIRISRISGTRSAVFTSYPAFVSLREMVGTMQ